MRAIGLLSDSKDLELVPIVHHMSASGCATSLRRGSLSPLIIATPISSHCSRDYWLQLKIFHHGQGVLRLGMFRWQVRIVGVYSLQMWCNKRKHLQIVLRVSNNILSNNWVFWCMGDPILVHGHPLRALTCWIINLDDVNLMTLSMFLQLITYKSPSQILRANSREVRYSGESAHESSAAGAHRTHWSFDEWVWCATSFNIEIMWGFFIWWVQPLILYMHGC